MAPRKVDPEARRAEILAAAVRVFARKGFAASRIEDVAAEAGIAKGSVYLAFESREALLRAAFDEFAAESADQLRRATAGSGPAIDRLTGLIRSTFALLTGAPELSRMLLDLWSIGRGVDADLPLDMAAVYEGYRTAIADLLRAAGADGAVRPGLGIGHAAVVVGAIEGCLLQWLIDPALPVAALADTIIDVCVNGLGTEKNS
ncbi:TetR/AcrR family transcriptional regulator [Nocardia terpenica]|uniref:TetR family transcriptional regulator n=1 Tax=Nocardia terpenica TaxID=455432 RepID=A0A6G9Z1L7_9NOCA|nr:TetR/AcrR family transcriptional regulator [Nocardia terpenica]QIS19509.1 TetR family transcriptional regulator [Nocardia terpenica]